MSRLKGLITVPRINIALFVVAALLLAVSAVGGTRAALTYFSETYTTRLEVSQIGVTLTENGQDVAWRNYDSGSEAWTQATGSLLDGMLAEGEELNVGQAYDEAIAVRNSGEIGQYVRVELTKYWVDAQGNKQHNVSPSLINVKLANDPGWLQDQDASTEERAVFYYSQMLAPGAVTPALTESISIDPMVATKVEKTVTEQVTGDDGKTYTTFTTTYQYDGLTFCLEAEVDAVQEHNAQSAILSAWGKNVAVSDGVVSLEGEVK